MRFGGIFFIFTLLCIFVPSSCTFVEMSVHVIYHSRRISNKSIRTSFSEAFDLEKCVFWATTSEKTGFDCANEAIKRGARLLVAVGGDGTVNEVGQAIVKAQVKDPELKIRMGILPRGSANDLVKSLNISNNIRDLAQWIRDEQTFQMDVGVLHHDKSEYYFFNAMDAGMGADAIQFIEKLPRRIGSKLAYQIGILKSMACYQNRRMRMVMDGQILDGNFRVNIISNGNFIGQGHCVSPEGCMDDGYLEVLCVGDVTVWDYIKQIPKLKRQEYIDHPLVTYYKVREIEIMGDAYTELDGEFGPKLPVKISVLPRALEVFSPLKQGSPIP